MKNKILIVLLSILISIIITPLRSGYFDIGSLQGIKLSSIVALFLYFFFTLYWLHKTKEEIKPLVVILCTILGAILLRFPIHIYSFNNTLGTLLEGVMHILPPLGAYLFFRIKKYRWQFLILFFSLGIWFSTAGNDYWLHLLNHKTFTGTLEPKEMQHMEFQNKEGETLQLSDFRGKVVMMDFWHTYCGICYKKFPHLQEVYESYDTNEDIFIVAMHARLEEDGEDSSTGTVILNERGYNYPCYSIDINNPIVKEIGVLFYPTVVIFDSEGKLVFRGDIEKATTYLKKLL